MNQDSEELFLLDLSARQLSLRRDGDADPAVHLRHAAHSCWDYGDKPTQAPAPRIPSRWSATAATASSSRAGRGRERSAGRHRYDEVKKALRKAIEPVTGDAVFVERWETRQDAQGNLDLEDLGASVEQNLGDVRVAVSVGIQHRAEGTFMASRKKT